MSAPSDRPIVVMAPLPPPNWGGLHAVIEAVSPHVREAGYEIRPVVPAGAAEITKRFEAANIAVAELKQSRLRRSTNPAAHLRFLHGLFQDPQALRHIARHWDAKIIQAAGLHNVQGPLAARAAGLGLIWQIHSDFLPPLARRCLTPIAVRLSDVIMVNGARVRAAFPLLECLPDERIFEFRAPVDVSRFDFSEAERRSARERLGVSERIVLIGTVGARSYQKAHERVVDLAKSLDGDPRVRTVIIGGEIAGQAEAYQRDVRKRAEQSGLVERRKIAWVDAGSRVLDYLPALDIFVMPSRAEGIPVAMLEAMAASLPVIASEVGSIGEVIEPEVNGLLVRAEPFQSDRFAAFAQRMVNDPDLRARLGAAARETARRHFSAKSVADVHIEAYKIASERRASLNRKSPW